MDEALQAIDSAPQNGIQAHSGCVDAFQGIILTQSLVGLPLIPAISSLPPSQFREAVYQQLHQSIWHGLTWVDFGFAGFVMVMGLEISLASRLRGGAIANRNPYPRILRLAALLFFLGLIDNGALHQNWPNVRVTGFLQRMAICYLVGSLIYLNFPSRIRYALVPLILFGYWLVLAYAPVPGGKTGDFTFDGNLAAWVDQRFLPGSHYYGKWDPDGILTTIPAIASCLIGTIWGDLLRSSFHYNTKLCLFLVGGIVAINLGALSESELPINRSLWTSSYVLVTAGIGTILLGACYFLVDVMRQGRWLFSFAVMGHHFLVAFLLMEMIPIGSMLERLTSGTTAIFLGQYAPFFQALAEILLIWLIMFGLCQCHVVSNPE